MSLPTVVEAIISKHASSRCMSCRPCGICVLLGTESDELVEWLRRECLFFEDAGDVALSLLMSEHAGGVA